MSLSVCTHTSFSAVLCPEPPPIQNGMRTFTGISVGDTATYTCSPGFELIGNSTTACTRIDVNSVAFAAAPECRREWFRNITIQVYIYFQTGRYIFSMYLRMNFLQARFT